MTGKPTSLMIGVPPRCRFPTVPGLSARPPLTPLAGTSPPPSSAADPPRGTAPMRSGAWHIAALALVLLALPPPAGASLQACPRGKRAAPGWTVLGWRGASKVVQTRATGGVQFIAHAVCIRCKCDANEMQMQYACKTNAAVPLKCPALRGTTKKSNVFFFD